MTRDDERWLNEQIANDRASQPNERAAVWLLICILLGWLALGSCIALAIRLVEVLRG